MGHAAALDDQSTFIASLGSSRSPRMRDVLGTIAGRPGRDHPRRVPGALVVDGGPGTGKTVVALHRTAYLLYADPRLGHRRGGVLFVGPHQPYLAYVADVLPSLGEEGVRTCTLRELVPEGATAAIETDPEVARLKASADLVRAIEPAVALYEEPPTEGMEVERPGARSGSVLRSGPRRSGRRTPVRRTTRRATRSGRSWSPSSPTSWTTRRSHPTSCAPRCSATRSWCSALGGSWPLLDGSRPGRRPVVGARLSAQVRTRSRRRTGPQTAAAGAAGLDRLRPAAPRRGAAAGSVTPSPRGEPRREATLAAEREEMSGSSTT